MDELVTKLLIRKYHNDDFFITCQVCKLFKYHKKSLFNNSKKVLTLWNNIRLDNKYTPREKNKLFLLFQQYNFIKNAISRLQQAFLFRKYYKKFEYDFDLELNDISEKPENDLLFIHQNNTSYRFTLSDVMKMMRHSLLNSQYMIPKPLYVKNPYTNLTFQREDCYNFYVKCRQKNIPIDPFVKIFISHNTDLYEFKALMYHSLIRNTLQDYIDTEDDVDLYCDLDDMFYYLSTTSVKERYNYECNIILPDVYSVTDEFMTSLVQSCKKMIFSYLVTTVEQNENIIAYHTRCIISCLKKRLEKNPYFWRPRVVVPQDSSPTLFTQVRMQLSNISLGDIMLPDSAVVERTIENDGIPSFARTNPFRR